MPTAANPVDPMGTDETYMPPSRSPWAETWHLLRKNRMAFSGLLIFMVFLPWPLPDWPSPPARIRFWTLLVCVCRKSCFPLGFP